MMSMLCSGWVLKKWMRQARRDGGEPDHRQRLDVDHLEPGIRSEQVRGRQQQRGIDLAVADPFPHRGALLLGGFGLRAGALLGRLGGFHSVDFSDELDVVAVDIEAALLEKEPVVEAGMIAAGPDLLAGQVGDAVDAVGRDMVAADELDLAVLHRAMGVGLRNLEVVIDVEPLLGPGARLRDHMQEVEMGRGPVRKRDFVHIAHASTSPAAGDYR
jgi:hypothetical protein